MKKLTMSKKGLALDTLAMLILAGLSLGIVLVILIQSGLLSNLSTVIGVSITTLESNIRGILIKLLWVVFWVVFALLGLMMLLGSTCRSLPVGAIICLAMFAVVIAVLTNAIYTIQGSIPFIDIPNPTISVPVGKTACGAGADPDVFKKEVAERSVDCWIMYGSGNFDPLAAKVPPNPRTCFVIDFNVNKPIMFSEIQSWMAGHDYPTGVGGEPKSYWQKAGNSIVLENNQLLDWGKYIKSGRLFIKYGDNMFEWSSIWSSADCSIRGDFSAPGGDHVYWCLDEAATCKSCSGNNCNLFSW